ncbi:hypothetical protein [Vibrio sp. AND4]|uniref:hypothetical protein n=1 Tax=Vibrio sp. AND4 TaxID=314289 RepID=UPI0005C77FA4|nr:hypothetical protein [Vibrio sp. AND4]
MPYSATDYQVNERGLLAMRSLLFTTFLFYLPNAQALTAAEPSLKFYHNTEVINKEVTNVDSILFESMTEEIQLDLLRFNAIEIKRCHGFNWQDTNDIQLASQGQKQGLWYNLSEADFFRAMESLVQLTHP